MLYTKNRVGCKFSENSAKSYRIGRKKCGILFFFNLNLKICYSFPNHCSLSFRTKVVPLYRFLQYYALYNSASK